MRHTTQSRTQAQHASTEAGVGALAAWGGVIAGAGAAIPAAANALSHGDLTSTIYGATAGLVIGGFGFALLRDEWKKSQCDVIIGGAVGAAISAAGYAYLIAPHIP